MSVKLENPIPCNFCGCAFPTSEKAWKHEIEECELNDKKCKTHVHKFNECPNSPYHTHYFHNFDSGLHGYICIYCQITYESDSCFSPVRRK